MTGARAVSMAFPRPAASTSMKLLRLRVAQASLQQPRLLQTSAPATAAPAASTSSSTIPPEASSSSAAAATASTAPARWTPTSRRVGLIAKKQGMTTFFLPTGERIPATVLYVASNQVSAHIGFGERATNNESAQYTAIQVAAVDSFSPRAVTKQIMGHLQKAGIRIAKKVIREFRVSKDALIPLGTYLSAAHFVPGQKIDVRAVTRGKGFQGVMKRHGFKGLRASHGVSVSHRSHGSTGQNQDPGRVFPGKKMAGRMGGNKHSTTHNLEVLRVDTKRDLVVVKGPVPGPEGGHVELCDASKDLVGRAAHAWRSGRLPDGKGMATGKEGSDEYLPEGIVDLPFPAGTRELARTMPEIVEVGPKAA